MKTGLDQTQKTAKNGPLMVSKCTNLFDPHDKTSVPKTETRVLFPLLLKNFRTTLNAQILFLHFPIEPF